MTRKSFRPEFNPCTFNLNRLNRIKLKNWCDIKAQKTNQGYGLCKTKRVRGEAVSVSSVFKELRIREGLPD